MNAADLLAALLDPGCWRSWDAPPADVRPGPTTRPTWPRPAPRPGSTSRGHRRGPLGGRRVAVVISEFGFLGGSIGVAAADRLARAVERATAERLPLIAAPSSGGTRMQEGTVAFLQMVKISAAVAAHKAAGLPYLVYLRHPTTGGVMASWGSLGHLTVAEPGALVGFLGPRVYEALYGEPVPGRRADRGEPVRARARRRRRARPRSCGGCLSRALHVLARRTGAPPPTPRPGRRGPRRRPGSRSPAHPPPGPARRTPAAAVRRDRRGPAQRHRRGRGRPGLLIARPVRRPPLRLPGPGPRGRHRHLGPGGAARGAARDAAGRRARPAAGHRHRHPGRRAVARGRGGRPGRRDRPLPRRPGHPACPDLS